MTSRNDIGKWFDEGVEQKATLMIVVCDTYDYDDYPVYVNQGENFWSRYDSFDGQRMQRIMEVYDLTANKAEQLTERRAMRLPKRATPAAAEVQTG